MCNNEVAKFLHKFKRTLKTNNLFMNIFKFYYLLIGLFIVLASILFEVFREPTNFMKGLFSINVGLIVLFLSIKNRENIEINKETIFFWSTIIIWFITDLLNNSIELLTNNDIIITLIISFSIIVSYFHQFFKR